MVLLLLVVMIAHGICSSITAALTRTKSRRDSSSASDCVSGSPPPKIPHS